MEKPADQMGVFIREVQAVDIRQLVGDFPVQIVQNVLGGVDLIGGDIVPAFKAGKGGVIVFQRHIAHALYLALDLRHGDGRRVQQASVKVTQPHFAVLCRFFGPQEAGQLFQQPRCGEKDQSGHDIEDDVNQRDLQLQRTGIVPRDGHADPVCKGNKARGCYEQDRADRVEQQVNDGGPARCGACAAPGDQGSQAGPDVLAEQDVYGCGKRDQALPGQSLQETDARGGGIQHNADDGADQYAEDRIGNALDRGFEAFPFTHGDHGVTHALHADEQETDAHDDRPEFTDDAELFLFFREAGQDKPEKGKQHAEVDALQGKQQRGHGGADVGAHDNAYGLDQAEHIRVDKADDHDGGGGGGLDQHGDQDTAQHGQEAVAGHGLKKDLQLVARRFFKAFTQHLHTEHEDPERAQKINQHQNDTTQGHKEEPPSEQYPYLNNSIIACFNRKDNRSRKGEKEQPGSALK